MALSGGLDSASLLTAVHHWRRSHGGPSLKAIHVNHKIQAAADDWARRSAALCESLDVELVTTQVALKHNGSQGLEAAARVARYAAFEEVLGEGDVLLLAHHRDDQVETLLLRLLRGAGPVGLSGMPRSRPLGAGILARPWLALDRAAIVAWAESERVVFVQDPSNDDSRFDRNFLRNEVLPLIEKRWPGYRQSLSRVAELQGEVSADLLSQAVPEVKSVCGDPGVSLRGIDDDGALAALLHRWLTLAGILPPARAQLREFARQCLSARQDRQPSLALRECQLVSWQGAVYRIPRELPDVIKTQAIVVGQPLTMAGGQVFWLESAGGGLPEGLAMECQPLSPSLRLPLPRGIHKTVKQLCQERGVPPWWRERLPLLCLAGEPYWAAIIGYLTDAGAGFPIGLVPEAGCGPLLQPTWQPF